MEKNELSKINYTTEQYQKIQDDKESIDFEAKKVELYNLLLKEWLYIDNENEGETKESSYTLDELMFLNFFKKTDLAEIIKDEKEIHSGKSSIEENIINKANRWNQI